MTGPTVLGSIDWFLVFVSLLSFPRAADGNRPRSGGGVSRHSPPATCQPCGLRITNYLQDGQNARGWAPLTVGRTFAFTIMLRLVIAWVVTQPISRLSRRVTFAALLACLLAPPLAASADESDTAGMHLISDKHGPELKLHT